MFILVSKSINFITFYLEPIIFHLVRHSQLNWSIRYYFCLSSSFLFSYLLFIIYKKFPNGIYIYESKDWT